MPATATATRSSSRTRHPPRAKYADAAFAAAPSRKIASSAAMALVREASLSHSNLEYVPSRLQLRFVEGRCVAMPIKYPGMALKPCCFVPAARKKDSMDVLSAAASAHDVLPHKKRARAAAQAAKETGGFSIDMLANAACAF
jgi:hypothetical protein